MDSSRMALGSRFRGRIQTFRPDGGRSLCCVNTHGCTLVTLSHAPPKVWQSDLSDTEYPFGHRHLVASLARPTPCILAPLDNNIVSAARPFPVRRPCYPPLSSPSDAFLGQSSRRLFFGPGAYLFIFGWQFIVVICQLPAV